MEKPCDETAYHQAYPAELASAEQKLLNVSRKARKEPPVTDVRESTGIALSGGGIRSATFCLGVFQGLAGLKLLKKLDYISTVSGGGYFGSFYTRFFLRKEVTRFGYVEETLARTREERDKDKYQRNILTWLRENGRYLSPRGSGDLLLLGTAMLRNWIVVQIVLATFFLLIFLSAQLLRIWLDPLFCQKGLFITLPGHLKLWVSSFFVLPSLLFMVWAVPLGWAYWMVGRQAPVKEFWQRPATGLIVFMVVAILPLVWFPGNLSCFLLASGICLLALLTAIWSFAAGYQGTETLRYTTPLRDEAARSWVSNLLKIALVTTAAALAFVAVDSLGQTVYLVLLTPGATLGSWGGGLLAAIAALVPFASRIMISSGGDRKRRPATLTKLAAAVGAFVLVTTLLVTFSVAANAIAWSLKSPTIAPEGIGTSRVLKISQAEIQADKGQPNQWKLAPKVVKKQADQADRRDEYLLGGGWLLSLLFTFLFGQSWPFLNRSTQLPLYSARLTRAYLGASNPRRLDTEGDACRTREGGAITRVIPGDDIDIEYYWPWPPPPDANQKKLASWQEEIYTKGTPLHLVNVTINETLDGKSQVQQQDRKGTGLAFGPAGASAGIRHHAVFERDDHTPGRFRFHTFPKEGFRIFDYCDKKSGGEIFRGERLPLGQLLSISGAAFSTGIGARTNLALSLLAGIANVRLGYWWNSGIAPRERRYREEPKKTQKAGGLFTWIFPVHSYLLDEYTARYHGTARQHWYLSDGGHFENMGGYEMIRRRLRLIIVIDAEADPDYTFGGLGNLVRKARIDFAAEIKFLDEDELKLLGKRHKHRFTPLENLRRGKWIEESLPPGEGKEAKRQLIDPVDHTRYSLAHAAVARVSYDGKEQAESCLVYLKPTVAGDEPLDVLQYHVEHPAFPQETTADQFFDEAQWESYRALGEHIAREVFGADEEWWDALVKQVLKRDC